MAFKTFCIVLAIIFPAIVSAKEFIVGDDKGWRLFFDYQEWAQDKDFYVGDKLVFTYAAGDHNVLKVNESSYETCIAPPSNEALTSGFDTVNLTTPGRHWYICGKENHCKVGVQKLSIVVQCAEDLPTGANVSPSNGVLVNMVHPVMVALLGLVSILVFLGFN